MTGPTPHRRTLVGTVVSDKMQKTVVVAIERVKTHPRYGKQFRVRTTFKAHDERNEFHVGDRVLIEETRPRSREKRWRVRERLGAQPGGAA